MKRKVILQKALLITAEVESEDESAVTRDAMQALIDLNRGFKDLVQEWADENGYKVEYLSSRLGGLCSERKV